MSIEALKSLQLQNLLTNSIRCLDIIKISCAIEKTEIINICSTSDIRPNEVSVLLNRFAQLRLLPESTPAINILDNRSKHKNKTICNTTCL